MEVVIYEFSKNSRERVRVSIKVFKDVRGIDFRVYFRDRDGNLKPGGKGLWLKVELLPELKRAVLALEKALAEEVPPGSVGVAGTSR